MIHNPQIHQSVFINFWKDTFSNQQTKHFWKVSNPVCSLLYMSFHFIAIPLCYAQCPANWESSAQNLDVQSWPKKNCFWYKISGNYLVKVIQLFFTVDIFAVYLQSIAFKCRGAGVQFKSIKMDHIPKYERQVELNDFIKSHYHVGNF